jgi:hypothetical protein
MKIDNIIKKALFERGLISEAAGDPTTAKTGQETKSFDLNDPNQVINAALMYNCWQQWGLKSKPADGVFNQEYKFSYRGKPVSVSNNERYLMSGPITSNPLVFLGRKAEGEVDSDDTWFMGFNSADKFNDLYKGFRWRCKQLKTLDQAGTTSLSQAQQSRLDSYLKTDGSVYTKVGGPGMEAKDVSTLTFKSGKPVFDENTGIPPKGNFVYIQTGLENLDINQLASIAKYLDDNNWSLTVPSMSEPSFNQGRSVVSIFPRAKDYGLSDNVKVYPKKAENVTYTPTKTNVLGKDVTDKASCTKAINYLTACMKNPFKNADCQSGSTRVKNVETASMCYLELSKQKTKNPTKLLGGIFGPEDELMRLVNVSNNVYGIGPRVRELGGTSSMNESKKINLTIKKHLLENIRQKNSWK